jgi:zinc transporter ZupT
LLDGGPLEPQVTTAGECELHSFGSAVQHRQVHSSHQHHQHQQQQQHLPLSNQRLHTLDGSTQQGHSVARLHRVSSPRGQQGHSAARLHTLDGGHSSAQRLHQVLDLDGELQPLNREASSSAMLAPLVGTPSHAAQQPDCHSAHVKVFLAERPLSFATTVLLAGALCVHSILEGMALGAQQSMKDTEDIMIAIAAHKGLAAYALGASIVESKASASKFWTVVRGPAARRRWERAAPLLLPFPAGPAGGLTPRAPPLAAAAAGGHLRQRHAGGHLHGLRLLRGVQRRGRRRPQRAGLWHLPVRGHDGGHPQGAGRPHAQAAQAVHAAAGLRPHEPAGRVGVTAAARRAGWGGGVGGESGGLITSFR